ncbi:MAG TPA: hypothetical protein VLE89_05250 [Chlamydiales bacterium]|nr:hypothetical protein [Chlamydiales bacterium]
MLQVGIDFDNTIACYDDVFYKAALEKNLIPPTLSPAKTEIRDYFRKNNREPEWTELQGYVYGTRMDLASPFPSVDLFFSHCRKNQIQLSIISHKTKHPYLGPRYDLHEAARTWILKQSFFYPELQIFFELTLEEKLNRIAKMQCDLFIDDLPEVLSEPAFPKNVQKILFDPHKLYPHNGPYTHTTHWNDIFNLLK